MTFVYLADFRCETLGAPEMSWTSRTCNGRLNRLPLQDNRQHTIVQTRALPHSPPEGGTRCPVRVVLVFPHNLRSAVALRLTAALTSPLCSCRRANGSRWANNSSTDRTKHRRSCQKKQLGGPSFNQNRERLKMLGATFELLNPKRRRGLQHVGIGHCLEG